MSENRNNARNLAKQYTEQGKPTEWFEVLYSQAQGDNTKIPWADMQANPNLVEWLDKQNIQGQGKTALKIGCGLGDDAEELSKRGFQVTAFDISISAIEWCKNRFPDSSVQYIAADLLKPLTDWNQAFDFVVESYTLQVLPPELRKAAIPIIANFLTPGGRLLVICRGRNIEDESGKMPYPLIKNEVMEFVDAGLSLLQFEDYLDNYESPPVRRFRAEFKK
jgi:SAM-dependent methyltransferase